MWPIPQFPANLVTFTEETPNVKLHFFAQCQKSQSHDQNDEMNNPLNLSGNICKGHIQNMSNTFWPNWEHLTTVSC